MPDRSVPPPIPDELVSYTPAKSLYPADMRKRSDAAVIEIESVPALYKQWAAWLLSDEADSIVGQAMQDSRELNSGERATSREVRARLAAALGLDGEETR